jgi:hypothetical protein
MNKEIMHSDYSSHPETVGSEEELGIYLSGIAEEIGWIIIYFNSLEDLISSFSREMMLRDPCQDERLDIFLAEMGYAAKARALIHLYGQAVTHGAAGLPANELVELEKDLTLAATLRNGYAHADWIGLRDDAYVRVKTRSSRNGILHRYKRIDVETARADVTYITSLRDRLEAVHELVLDSIYRRSPEDETAWRTLPPIKYPSSADSIKRPDRAYDERRDDILNALLALGFPNHEAFKAMTNLPLNLEAKEGIKVALQILEKGPI